MKKGAQLYSLSQKISAAGMILALIWLTVSTPFVFASQQQKAVTQQVAEELPVCSEEDASNPFSSTTEEKAPSSTVLSEEYLHDQHAAESFFSSVLRFHKCENADTYNAFHGELLVPPPNAAV